MAVSDDPWVNHCGKNREKMFQGARHVISRKIYPFRVFLFSKHSPAVSFLRMGKPWWKVGTEQEVGGRSRVEEERREAGSVQTSPQGRLPGSRELSLSPGTWAPSLVREGVRGSGRLAISPQLGGTAYRATHQSFYSGSDCCRNNVLKITRNWLMGPSGKGRLRKRILCFRLILFYTNNMQRYYFWKMPKRLSHLWNFGPIGFYLISIFKKTINVIESSYCTSKISETALSFNILSLWSHRV